MQPWVIATLAGAAGCAALDWWAVGTGRPRVEYVAKPATMAVLIAATCLLDPSSATVRAWFVGALVLSLLGDVALLGSGERAFLAGLGAFLGAHLGYLGGLLSGPTASGQNLGQNLCQNLGRPALAALGVVGLAVVVGWPIVRGAARASPRLAVPVVLYLIAIAAMTTAAVGTGRVVLAAAGLAFMASDAVLGLNRFVRPLPAARVVIMVTYHAAQALFVLSLPA